jgi:dienelactone hydrolase
MIALRRKEFKMVTPSLRCSLSSSRLRFLVASKGSLSAILIALFVWALPALSELPPGEFIEAKGATAAVILAHGRGAGPDSQVVGPLRRAINKDVGLHTLSLQMPVLTTPDYIAYAATFPDAYKTLQSAIDSLSKEKGVKRIYVMGYSMGARMTTAFLASRENSAVVGYIGVGLLAGGGDLLDANINIQKLKIPVIDIYADSTPLDLSSAQNRKSLVGDRYKQVQIRGANHSFHGYEGALSDAVVAWLKEREGAGARPESTRFP